MFKSQNTIQIYMAAKGCLRTHTSYLSPYRQQHVLATIMHMSINEERQRSQLNVFMYIHFVDKLNFSEIQNGISIPGLIMKNQSKSQILLITIIKWKYKILIYIYFLVYQMMNTIHSLQSQYTSFISICFLVRGGFNAIVTSI